MTMKEEGDHLTKMLEIKTLRQEIASITELLLNKKKDVEKMENELRDIMHIDSAYVSVDYKNKFNNENIERYSRQLLLPNFGVSGQLKLENASILIIGVGGLGCPAAQYLVSAGVGRIGLVDYDNVDRSNIHRQILHNETRINLPKVISAQMALSEINPQCIINTYCFTLNDKNATEVIQLYDVVLDCSDNVATRYLLNDACVMLKKPLVSGSALQLEGQLTVYNFGDDGPCYRCLYPVPPPPESVTNCGDGGVLGAVTGTIGSLQALEAIKIVIGNLGKVLSGQLLIFDGAACMFRKVKLRSRRANCDVCSNEPLITHLINYEQFCGMHASDKEIPLRLLDDEQRISAQYYYIIKSSRHVLIDVRPPTEFEIGRLPSAINIPMKEILDDGYINRLSDELELKLPIILVCRRGNDSQIAVQHMLLKYPQHDIQDIIGGLRSWHNDIDKEFPIY